MVTADLARFIGDGAFGNREVPSSAKISPCGWRIATQRETRIKSLYSPIVNNYAKTAFFENDEYGSQSKDD
jgi:hypothetical protein